VLSIWQTFAKIMVYCPNITYFDEPTLRSGYTNLLRPAAVDWDSRPLKMSISMFAHQAKFNRSASNRLSVCSEYGKFCTRERRPRVCGFDLKNFLLPARVIMPNFISNGVRTRRRYVEIRTTELTEAPVLLSRVSMH